MIAPTQASSKRVCVRVIEHWESERAQESKVTWQPSIETEGHPPSEAETKSIWKHSASHSKHANANNKRWYCSEEGRRPVTSNQAVERATTEDDGQPEVKVDKSQHLWYMCRYYFNLFYHKKIYTTHISTTIFVTNTTQPIIKRVQIIVTLLYKNNGRQLETRFQRYFLTSCYL